MLMHYSETKHETQLQISRSFPLKNRWSELNFASDHMENNYNYLLVLFSHPPVEQHGVKNSE